MELAKRFSGITSPAQAYLEGTMELHIHLSAAGDGVCVRCLDRSGHAGRFDVSEMSMLIAVGQLVEHLEQREAMVWLKPLNQCDLFGCQMLQGAGATSIRPFWEILCALADRKLSALLLGMGVMQGKIENDVIQCGTCMKGVLTNEASSFWRNLEQQVCQNLHSIIVRFSDGNLECIIHPPLNEQFKLVELFPCPFYSDLRRDERVHAELSLQGSR